MIQDRQALIDSLFGLVGYTQTDNPKYPKLNASLITSRSGRSVMDETLMTIENIDQTIRNFSQFTYTAFGAGVEYSLGDMVSSAGINYAYINATPSTGNSPPNATFWEVISNLDDYLTKAMKKGIGNTLDAVLNDKKMRGRITSIYDNILLFDGLANYTNFVDNESNFVGLRLRLKRNRSLISIINKIGTQFSTVLTGDLTLTLYHSSLQTAVTTFTITPASEAKKFTWLTLSANNILRYLSELQDAGGDFYLGYKQSDLEALGGKALKKNLTWDSTCGCNDLSDWYFSNFSRYISVIGFQIKETELVADKLFNPQLLTLITNNNFGINLNLSQKCDIADILKQEETQLANAVQLYTTLHILRDMADTTRQGNGLANNVAKMAQEQTLHHAAGWGTVFDRAVAAGKAFSFDFSGMDDDCMPHEDVTVSIGSEETRLA